MNAGRKAQRSQISADELIVAGLVLAAVTGVVLARHFDGAAGAASISTWLLASPRLDWVRALHAWSTVPLLAGVLWRWLEAIRARSRLSVVLTGAALLVAVYVVVSGVLLRGDPLAEHVRTRVQSWSETSLPVGDVFGALLWGRAGTLDLMLFVHALAIVPLIAVLVRHVRFEAGPLRWTRVVAIGAAMSVFALVCAPGLAGRADDARGGLALLTSVRRGVALNRHVEGGPGAVRVVRGQAEGCLVCHQDVQGLAAGHDPGEIGCASCHLGDSLAATAAGAHRGLVRIPGNLANAAQTCGQAGCHESVVPRVDKSIMTTMAGVVAVDRKVFGEPVGDAVPDVRALGHSPADSHLRQLCASCHLAQPKEQYGALTEASRGGGCTACHLVYSAEAERALATYTQPVRSRPNPPPVRHPKLSVNPEMTACFGCHSRSGRISTNYEGWIEAGQPGEGMGDHAAGSAARPNASESGGAARPADAAAGRRNLEDGRVLVRAEPDVHRERGLECIDCHTSSEVMGRGTPARTKHEQSFLRCEDCHAVRLPTLDRSQHDSETETLLRLRGVALPAGARIASSRSGDPLVNVVVGTDGAAELVAKASARKHPLRAPATACRSGKGHARLSCESCHTAWAPRCISCHTSFDSSGGGFDHLSQDWVKGSWEEKGAPAVAVPPTLGVRIESNDGDHPAGSVDTFIPGMVLQLDRQRDPRAPADPVFERLYARTAPHTTRREARSCASCHADPVALGFGEGALGFEITGATGRWRFFPKHALLPQDGLPEDAWTGFLQTREGRVSTRDDVRPFNVEEQKAILRVGACLTCHAEKSAVMTRARENFDAEVAARSAKCVMPVFE